MAYSWDILQVLPSANGSCITQRYTPSLGNPYPNTNQCARTKTGPLPQVIEFLRVILAPQFFMWLVTAAAVNSFEVSFFLYSVLSPCPLTDVWKNRPQETSCIQIWKTVFWETQIIMCEINNNNFKRQYKYLWLSLGNEIIEKIFCTFLYLSYVLF